MEQKTIIINCDGASRGNPGPAAAGAILRESNSGNVLAEISEFLGTRTNNEAEYTSLIMGLNRVIELAGSQGFKPFVEVRMDSELVVKQILGTYKVKKETLKPLHANARELLDQIGDWKIKHVPRSDNAEADRLANMAYK